MRAKFVVIGIFLAACSRLSDVDMKSIEEFLYPYEDLKDAKSFIFQEIGGARQVIRTLQVIEKEGKRLLISVVENDSEKFDSTITSIDEPITTGLIYRFDYDSIGRFEGFTEGTIEEEYFENGTTYGGRRTEINLEKNYIEAEDLTIMEFIKDTFYFWNNVKLEALYFEYKGEYEMEHSFIPFIGKSAKYSGYTIYAKNLGQVKYVNNMEGDIREFELVSIE